MQTIQTSQASTRDQAKRIHDRLAGVPATDSVLTQMTTLIDQNQARDAALLAMEHDDFYSTTLKNWVTPWTNLDQTVFSPLNDYTALVVGVVRDDLDFRRILYDDLAYVANSSYGAPAFSINNNNHYEFLETQGISLKDALEQTLQSSLNGLPADATAGIQTTRAGAKAFFIDGTNRAMFRFTLMNHLCHDLEQVKDITRSPDRIRQDVTRSPGGDSRIFLNNCIGCHSGMDPMAQAYAYYQYEYDSDNDPDGESGRMVYNSDGMLDPITGTRVQAKYHINSTNFPYGFVTPDDSWENYWRAGQNSLLGWDSNLPGLGNGAKSMGQELAHSKQFATCQVQKVFKTVCLRDPVDSADRNQISTMLSSFQANGYKLKEVFADSAVYCMGPQ